MYQAIIARIKTKPHPNADRIQLADVCGTTVVVGLNHQDGELGVYFPSDGVLSHEFCLANNLYSKSARQKLGLGDGPIGFFDHHRRVRTQGFRGQKSDGFWLSLGALEPWAPEDYSDLLIEGTMFDTLNGHQLCSKWTTRQVGAANTPSNRRNKELLAFPKHMDTEQWDYYWKDIPDGSLLTITEKIHGTSHRVGLVQAAKAPWWRFWNTRPDYQIVHGSRNVVLTQHSGRTSYYGSDEFRYKAVGTPNLRKGEVVYGEIVGFVAASSSIMPAHAVDRKELPTVYEAFGPNVQYHYGQADGHAKFIVYRIVQFNEDGEGTELSHPQVVRRATALGYDVVPHHNTHVWSDKEYEQSTTLVQYLVGDIFKPSLVAPNQMAEGVVIRVDTPDGHTRFLKKKSYAFKLLEGIIKSDESYADIEENA